MKKMTVLCPAKINLSLDVIGKRDDGYHFLKMIMQGVGLYDKLTIQISGKGINISCNDKNIPCDSKNTAYKAAEIIIKKFNINKGVDLFIEKNIPSAAGLAGGSSDAAGVIKAMNEIFDLNMSLQEMMDIGLMVGADVPYCILGGTALSEGIGEILTPIKPLKETWCLLAKPPISVSTGEVYGNLKINEIENKPNTERLIEYINNDDVKSLCNEMVNVLETVTIKRNPIITEIKNIMLEHNAMGSMMSGSGPTVFGLFESKALAEKCYEKLKEDFNDVFLVKTL